MAETSSAVPVHQRGSSAVVFGAFLRLGLSAFGGPIAHIGYLREAFVQQRRWLSEAQFAQLLAVCQFLPGPASSQLGFAIGLLHAGWRGALAAFIGFTLPSALLMFAFAVLAERASSEPGLALLQGLKLVAVVVVAHGVMGMARQLAPDAPRALIAAAAAALVVLGGQAWLQLLAIALGAVLGWLLCRGLAAPAEARFVLGYGPRRALLFLLLFALGLLLALLLTAQTQAPQASPAALAATFYQAGALVFGGGHVVLPLLQQGVVDSGWLGADGFLAGYGAAQAVPGPMFSFAAYLGAEVDAGLPAAAAAAIALLAVFLPGFLLLLAVLPVWSRLLQRRWALGVVAGINAAVVGLLAAALYDPVWTQGVRGPVDFAVAVIGFALLAGARVSALWVVLWCVLARWLAAMAGF
jgi:chromate transporter